MRELGEKRRRAEQSLTEWQHAAPVPSAGWDDLMHTWNRSLADLPSLRMRLPEVTDADLLAAGTPRFMTIFGRDSIISALQTLLSVQSWPRERFGSWQPPQALLYDPERDAEPGKIIHELRRGKRHLPGSTGTTEPLDATPLFLTLLSDLWRWTDDPTLPLEETARRALAWIAVDPDLDGDGFAEFERRSSHGLPNQTWRDSDDSMGFRDGTLARPPTAPGDVQWYIYDTK